MIRPLCFSICILTASILYSLQTSASDVLTPTRIKGPPRIDGVLTESFWSSAFEADELVSIDPDTGNPGKYPTRVKIAYDSQALYLGVTNEQPSQTQIRRISSRDQRKVQRDAIRVVLDPSGAGQYGYLYEVALGGSLTDGTVRPGRDFAYSWDCPWRAKTSQDSRHWYAEIAIPWDAMELPESSGKRRMGIYLQRSIAHLSEYWALPGIPLTTKIFLESLAPLDVYGIDPRRGLILYPYASVSYDGIKQSRRDGIGSDIFWQPTSNLLVAATVNPDFGQVENDEVTVNFGATETFLQDKRPFFVEGNDIFTTHNLKLIHTRRIGATPKRPVLKTGEGVIKAPGIADILAAAKITGQKGRLRFGLMSAFEDDADFTVDGGREITVGGRSFYAARMLHGADTSIGHTAVGYLGTFYRYEADEAFSHSLDAQWVTTDRKTRLETQVAVSNVNRVWGYAWNGKITYNPTGSTTYRFSLDHTDDRFDINQMGYLERNDRLKFNASYSTYRYNLPAFKRLSWSYRAFGAVNKHLLEMDVGGQIYIKHHNLSRTFLEAYYRPEARNDIDSHGHGGYRIKQGFLAYIGWTGNNSKPIRPHISVRLSTEENGGLTTRLRTKLAYNITDAWETELDLKYYDRKDWIIWGQTGRPSGFDADQLELEIDSSILFASNQELRLSIQWVGIDASERCGYQIAPDGKLLKTEGDVGSRSFDWTQMAGQVRYKYEFSPLSDLFLVYTRGSMGRWDGPSKTGNFGTMLRDSFDDRDVEVFLAKIRYRF